MASSWRVFRGGPYDACASDDEGVAGLTPQSFIGSALFEKTFEEGMSLVDETAKYLDGIGRDESRALPRKIAMLYAGESMRVTTRLMQAASWLLVQRACMTATWTRAMPRASAIVWARATSVWAEAARRRASAREASRSLDRSDNLYRRIARLDDVLFRGGDAPPGVQAQFEKLERAFGN